MTAGILRTILGAAMLLAALASPAYGGTARLALIVGSNRGTAPEKSLRYAERDAERFGALLADIGGFPKENIQVLKRPTRKDFQGALDTLRRRIREQRAEGAARTLALVYFSGHADGVHLELGSERLAFAELRDAVDGLRADVKLLLMDSCQSGGVTAYKGGRPGPAFDIAFTDTIDANGTAVLTSSAAGEKSQESGRLEGSYFTHFLLSGLLGAADFNQDQRVTLNEIYQYTYSKTVAETSQTMGGTQHPTYDFQITGRGEVVLTDLTHAASAVLFASEMQGDFLILKADTNEIAAEVTKPLNARRRAVLAPGRYRIAVRRRGTVYAAIVDLHEGRDVRLTNAAFRPEPKLERVLEKGGPPPTDHGVGVTAAYGMLSGALKRYSALHEGIVTLRIDAGKFSLFPKFTIGSAHIDESDFQYRLLLITGEAGVARRFTRSILDLFLGINLGVGYGRQELESELRTGTMFIYNLVTGLEFRAAKHLCVSVFWEVGSHVYRAENAVTQSLLLRGSVGIGARF